MMNKRNMNVSAMIAAHVAKHGIVKIPAGKKSGTRINVRAPFSPKQREGEATPAS